MMGWMVTKTYVLTVNISCGLTTEYITSKMMVLSDGKMQGSSLQAYACGRSNKS